MAEHKVPRYGTVLVFGGCGYLGSHIIEALQADGSFQSIVGASRNPRRRRIVGIEYKSCDVTDRAQVLKLLDQVKPQVIFHAVAAGAHESERAQYRLNYEATKQLLKLARNNAWVRAFVYTGSARAIASDAHTRTKPLTEDSALLHELSSSEGEPCERTRGSADALVRDMNTPSSQEALSRGAEGILLTTVIRVPTLYGQKDSRTSASILQQANGFSSYIQIGNNEAKHEWLYSENAAHAHILAAKALLEGDPRPAERRVDGEAFFVTDGEPVRFWDFPRKLWTAAGDKGCADPGRITVIPMELAITVVAVLEWLFWIFTFDHIHLNISTAHLRYIDTGTWWSIDKARSRLGYEPVCSTDEAIQRTGGWFQHEKQE